MQNVFVENRKKFKGFFFIILFVSVFFLFSVQTTSANPIYIPYRDYGGILPFNLSAGIEFQIASVTFQIDVSKKTNFLLMFSGVYTFFNPNLTNELQIGLPFGREYGDGVLEDIDLRINNTPTTYEHKVLGYDNSPDWWDLLFHDYWSRNFIVCNITFFEDTHTILSLRFSTNFEMRQGYIQYDVSTIRAWLTRIDERVKFIITGIQPESFSEGCKVSIINIGYTYVWNWENEFISAYSVGVYYDNRNWWQRIDSDVRGMLLFYGIPLFVIVVLPLTVLAIRKIKGRRERN